MHGEVSSRMFRKHGFRLFNVNNEVLRFVVEVLPVILLIPIGVIRASV